jgi:hypothetical protein
VVKIESLKNKNFFTFNPKIRQNFSGNQIKRKTFFLSQKSLKFESFSKKKLKEIIIKGKKKK